MTYPQGRSEVSCARTDNSGLVRSFEHAWIKGDVPSSIVYSKELSEFMEDGIELTTFEVDGLKYESIWRLCHAVVDAKGVVREFLLTQNADESVQLADDMPTIVIPGSYYVRFERRNIWQVRRRCVYLWEFGAADETLELNYVKMYHKLEVKPSSRYFENRIYELFDY